MRNEKESQWRHSHILMIKIPKNNHKDIEHIPQ